MRLLALPEVSCFVAGHGDGGAALTACIEGAELGLEERTPFVRRYEAARLESRPVFLDGIAYRIDLGQEGGLDLASLREGRTVLRDAAGRSPDLGPELLYLLIYASISVRPERQLRPPLVAGYVFRWAPPIKMAFVLGNLQSAALKHSADFMLFGDRFCLLQGRILGYDEDGSRFVRLDLDLKALWSYSPSYRPARDYVRGPELHGDNLIVSFGPSRTTRSPDPTPGDADWCHFHDALLACFAQTDGTLRWQRMVAKSIDTLELVGGRLYLACDDEILVLDPGSGETLACVDTGLKADYDRSLVLSSLHVEGEHLYFCHPGGAVLLVYRLADLELLRRVDIPAPYSIDRFGAVHPGTGRRYFHLRWREAPIAYFHMWPLLELDPHDLGAELRVEAGPPAKIDLRPSADEPGREEVWVELAESSLDEALIYGEMHAEDQAYYHGQLTSGLMNARLTPNFNGRVHLRVRCSDASPEQVQEKLAILRQRFARWAKDESVAAGCYPNRAVSLDARDSRLPEPEPAPAPPPAKPPAVKPRRKISPAAGVGDSKAKAEPVPRTLKARLVAAGLLPKSATSFGSYDALAAALVKANRKKPNLVRVLWDSDFTADGYRMLFQRLAQASGRPDDYLGVEVDQQGADRMQLRCTRDGQTLSVDWVQQTSAIAAEFVDFVERTVRHPGGRLLQLPDGESLTYLFLEDDLAELIEEWRESPEVKRLSFWWEHFHAPPDLDRDHPILSRQTYRRVFGAFAAAMLGSGNDPRNPEHYRVPVLCLPWFCPASQDRIEAVLRSTGSHRYVQSTLRHQLGIADIAPSVPVYVLLFSSPQEIAFEARTDNVEFVMSDLDQHFPYLVVDRQMRWSVCLFDALVVLAGDAVAAFASRIKEYDGGSGS